MKKAKQYKSKKMAELKPLGVSDIQTALAIINKICSTKTKLHPNELRDVGVLFRRCKMTIEEYVRDGGNLRDAPLDPNKISIPDMIHVIKIIERLAEPGLQGIELLDVGALRDKITMVIEDEMYEQRKRMREKAMAPTETLPTIMEEPEEVLPVTRDASVV